MGPSSHRDHPMTSEPTRRSDERIWANQRGAMSRMTLLEVENVETRYGRSQVMFDISLSIYGGEMVSLMGRNFMGKTTTLRSIMGLTPAFAGTIRFDGAEIHGLPAFRIAQRGIGLVP